METMEAVVSERNSLLKEVRRASARGSLTADGHAGADGGHLLEEALRSRCEISVVIASESAKTTVAAHARGLKHTRMVLDSDSNFDKLAATETTQRVIAL